MNGIAQFRWLPDGSMSPISDAVREVAQAWKRAGERSSSADRIRLGRLQSELRQMVGVRVKQLIEERLSLLQVESCHNRRLE